MILVSPFPSESAPELTRWLNMPREPNFEEGTASDLEAVTVMLAAKELAGQTFGAVVDGELVGFIGFTRATGMFAGMVLAPEHRGKGDGVRFLKLVLGSLRAQGVSITAAAVRPGNAAIQATLAAAGGVETARIYQFREGEN